MDTEEIDKPAKKLMSLNKPLHPRDYQEIMYVPRNEGLEDYIKKSK